MNNGASLFRLPIWIGGFAALTATGCPPPSTDAGSSAPPPARCEAGADASDLVDIDGVRVFLEDDSPHGDLLAAEAASYLSAMWGEPVEVARSAPDGDGPRLWLSTSDAAREEAGDVPDDGFVLRRQGEERWLVAAARSRDLGHGLYALLETLGARFFHPKDELVPDLGKPALPAELDEVWSPAFQKRGMHLHLLHPTEYLAPFHEPGEQNLADAKRTIDWLIKTGQNHVQTVMMSTVPLEPWLAHHGAIVEYAHTRGVTVGINVNLLDDAALLQNQYALVSDLEDIGAELAAKVDALYALPFDDIQISLGEFFASDPGTLLAALDTFVAYVKDTYPESATGIHNHVGEFDDLYVEYDGDTRYYYFLPGLADTRLVQVVHTVFFYDLYRDWGMYGHTDYHRHRQYILDMLEAGRDVYYFPESAYWVSADSDVPVFLTDYIYARWNDIHGLHRDIQDAGLPALDGHLLYSSGHEWSYWLIDYLTARFQWFPEASLEEHLAHYGAAFGACSDDVTASLSDLIDIQSRYLFDQKLVSYASGEDQHDDVGFIAGIETHPPRVPFEDVRDMSPDERRAFTDDVLKPLAAGANEMEAVHERLGARCANTDEALAGWCAELLDSIEVTFLRLRYSRALYVELLEVLDGKDLDLSKAKKHREAAGDVIARRAESYRWDLETLTGAYDNPTRYKFGYLRQAHTQCLWHRMEEQLTWLVETGSAALPFDVRTCQD